MNILCVSCVFAWVGKLPLFGAGVQFAFHIIIISVLIDSLEFDLHLLSSSILIILVIRVNSNSVCTYLHTHALSHSSTDCLVPMEFTKNILRSYDFKKGLWIYNYLKKYSAIIALQYISIFTVQLLWLTRTKCCCFVNYKELNCLFIEN